MTHLTFLALGSRGDVLPCAVLGHGLQAAGFTVRLISLENFAPMAAQYGLDFCPVSGDAQALLTSGSGLSLTESGQNVWKMWQSVKATFWDLATDMSNVLSQSDLWQTDGIINQLPGGLFGVDLAEKLDIPMITIKVTQMLLEALRRSGQRAVLQAGWAGIGQTKLPDTVYLLDYAPYSWLFPKMAAVIHHGGSGTTGFGFWAGVPTILTPFLFDQFYWGQRIEALGIGPTPIPFKKLTAEKLAIAIETAVSNPKMRQRATELGQIIQHEDGIGKAVDLVKEIVNSDR